MAEIPPGLLRAGSAVPAPRLDPVTISGTGGFLFVPYPAHGHVNPNLPVMAELVARGERVAAVVGAAFVDVVADVGVEPLRLPVEFDVQIPEGHSVPDTVHAAARRARKWLAGRLAARMLADRVARPGLVVVDPMAPWGALRRVPRVWLSTTFVSASMRARRRGPMVVNALPRLQPDRVGDVDRVVPLIRERDAVPGDGLPWSEMDGRPVLLVSPGTVFARGPRFFGAVVAAFGDTEWLVVMATGRLDPRSLGELPGNIVARSRVPQLALLSRSSVFLSHGGMNSVLESLSAGVPLVLAPRSDEQRATARRLARLGVGVEVDGRHIEPDGLRRLAERLARDPLVRGRLARVGVPARVDAVADVADLLCRYAGRGTCLAAGHDVS